MIKITVETVNDVLPQTQCGLCDHGGCKPYAKAIVEEGESINRCPPGGIGVLKKLGELTEQDPSPYYQEMQQKQKPRLLALIREAECIGCTKCIQVCPVDAIAGSGKLMHTVIASECTGCELCLPACPVDCIDLVETESQQPISKQESDHFRKRFEAREKRLEKISEHEKQKHTKAKKVVQSKEAMKKAAIAAAVARAKAKREQHG